MAAIPLSERKEYETQILDSSFGHPRIGNAYTINWTMFDLYSTKYIIQPIQLFYFHLIDRSAGRVLVQLVFHAERLIRKADRALAIISTPLDGYSYSPDG